MRALTALLLVFVWMIFASPTAPAAEPLLAVGGGLGFLGGLKAMLGNMARPLIIWQAVAELPAERRLSARFTFGFGSLGPISLTQLDTLLLIRLGGKIYLGVGSGLMRFVGADLDRWRLAGYGLVGLKSEVFKGATFFLDLKLIAFLPDMGSILAAGTVPFQFSFGMTFKL